MLSLAHFFAIDYLQLRAIPILKLYKIKLFKIKLFKLVSSAAVLLASKKQNL